VKVTATWLAAGSSATGTESIRTRSGAANMAAAVRVPSATMTSVSSRLAYASPPSSSSFMARTSCGTNTELRPPPTVRM
jgi:hypothetical protein